MSIAKIASRYISDYGIAIVPIPKGSKGPIGTGWNKPGGYFLDPDQAIQFFSRENNTNSSIGAVLDASNLVSFDVDNVEWTNHIFSEFGIDIFALRDACPTIQGDPGRFRIMFRAPEGVKLNRKSISWPVEKIDPENPDKKTFTVFEFRGGPVQDVLPPSYHPETKGTYRWINKLSKGLTELPEPLLNFWIHWDVFKPNAEALCPWAQRQNKTNNKKHHTHEGDDIPTRYNAENAIEDVLIRYGYKKIGKRYLSPNSSTKIPGVHIFDDNRCWSHHASDALCSDETGHPISPFDLYCHDEHGGDAKKAVKQLAKDWGLKIEPRKNKSEPVLTDSEPPKDDHYFSFLGYDRETYFVFHNAKKQIVELTASSMTEVMLLSLAPSGWWEVNFPRPKGDGFNKNIAAEWIMTSCVQRGIYDPSKTRGRGAWIDEGKVVFHLGSHLWVNGDLIDVTQHKSRFVYELARSLPAPSDDSLTDEEGKRLISISTKFRWNKPASAALVSGWIGLAFICGALRWRPHIWITGGAGCGKTTVLNEFIHHLMGGMDIYAQGNSTEAGIRQTLRCDALPVLFDESEQNNDREANRVQNVLSLIRQASSESAATTLKGTANGDAMAFAIRSMFCLSSIQVGMKHQADLERLSVLSLRPKHEDNNAADTWIELCKQLAWIKNDLTLPNRLFRRVLNLLPITLKNISVFTEAAARRFNNQRDGDQYGTLLAGCWSLTNSDIATIDQAIALIDSFEWEEYRENSETDESLKALTALLECELPMGGGVRASVYQVIKIADSEFNASINITSKQADELLQRYGMRVQDGHLFFSNNSTSLTNLMKNTPYAADLRGQLLRVHGMEKSAKAIRFNGSVSKAICIKIDVLEDL
jgi:Bifunctional DNA primase/polymerase, N-terminal